MCFIEFGGEIYSNFGGKVNLLWYQVKITKHNNKLQHPLGLVQFYLLQSAVLCLYVYCNLVEIIRGGSRKFRGRTSPPKALKKNTGVPVSDSSMAVGEDEYMAHSYTSKCA